MVTAGLATAAAVAAGTAGLATSASDGKIGEILPPIAAAITSAVITAAIAGAEAVLAPVCACSSVLLLAAATFHYSEYPSPWTRADSAASALVVHVGILEGIALLAVAANAFIAHWRRRQAIAEGATTEQAALDTVMAAVAEGDSGDSLPVVRELLNEMLQDLPAWEGSLPADGISWKGSVKRGLGPLLARAQVAACLLHRKAEEWALLSHGCFPVAFGCSGHQLIEWSSASRDPTLAASIRWPSVLAQQDALCKLGRVLPITNTSAEERLVGCCRVGVYFRDVGGVMALLETLRRDPAARVISLRSRLARSPACPAQVLDHISPGGGCCWDGSRCIGGCSRGCSSAGDGGLWCVAVDLLLVSDLSRRLGLESQVCELFLYLASCCSGLELLVCFKAPLTCAPVNYYLLNFQLPGIICTAVIVAMPILQILYVSADRLTIVLLLVHMGRLLGEGSGPPA